jgi:hypothetical protein
MGLKRFLRQAADSGQLHSSDLSFMAYGRLGGLAYGPWDAWRTDGWAVWRTEGWTGLAYGRWDGLARLVALLILLPGCPGQEIIGGCPMTRSKPKPSPVRRIG